jgi:hypothetical protein
MTGWGCSSAVEHLPSMWKALGLIPQNKTKQTEQNNNNKKPYHITKL